MLIPSFAHSSSWACVALATASIVGCGSQEGAATETTNTAASRPPRATTTAPAAAPVNAGPSLDAQARRFRRFVRTEFAGVGWADTITDAYVGGFVPTLNAATSSSDPEAALGICSAINLWILDTDSRYAERGKVRHGGGVVATCKPDTETELGAG